jgi:membrane-associated phospholipid phosphatase
VKGPAGDGGEGGAGRSASSGPAGGRGEPGGRAWVRQLARLVSIVGHPFVLAVVLVVVGGAGRDRGETLRALVLVLLCSILPLAWLMVRKVRRGEWADVDASRREERPLVFLVSLLGLAVLAVLLDRWGGAAHLARGVAATAAMLLAAAALTPWVKLSLHLAFAVLTAVVSWRLGSPLAPALAALLPILAWSRLALGRHRPSEVVAGTLLGLAAGLALVAW